MAMMQKFEMGIEAIRGQLHPPYMSKIEPEHIGKILDNADKSDNRLFIFAKRSQWFKTGAIALGVGVFLFLVIFLSGKQPDLLLDIMKVGLGFAGGLGAGYGLRPKKS